MESQYIHSIYCEINYKQEELYWRITILEELRWDEKSRAIWVISILLKYYLLDITSNLVNQNKEYERQFNIDQSKYAAVSKRNEPQKHAYNMTAKYQ